MKEKIDLEEIIWDIENTPPQTIQIRSKTERFQLRNDPKLTSDLSGGAGAYFIRVTLNNLNIDEHHLIKWRLENKYRQYQILNHYFPGCMAKTIGLSQILKENNGVQKIREFCEDGYFIKATLGDSTGWAKNFDRTEEIDYIIESVEKENDDLEKWVLQKRLNLKSEFRIHSFGKDVIYGLTFIINGADTADSCKAEEYLRNILEKLPDTIVQGNLIGWDIAVSKTNKWYVIEANISGFHPEYGRGFQTSGYFGDINYGSIICAWLNNYMHNKYQTSIGSVENFMLFHYPFYSEFLFYTSIFKKEHIDTFFNKVKSAETSILIYLDGDTESPFIKILKFFQMERFGKKYYLIVPEKHFKIVSDHFMKNELIEVINELTLFSNEALEHIKTIEFQERKRICCDSLLQYIGDQSYIIL